MKDEKRKEEINKRIVRDNPNPILMDNGVHRTESTLARKVSRDDSIKDGMIKMRNKARNQ